MRAAAVVRHVEARLRTLDIKPHRCCSCDIKSSHRDAMLRKGRKRALPLNSSLPLKRSLKMRSARFEKASEEIGVPRGKKSERYRSTPHYRSRSLVLALRKRLRKSGYREGRKASATAQPLTDGQTDDNLLPLRA